MMSQVVGVRELKARVSEVIRAVRERRARYTITYRGRPVAVLLPLDSEQEAAALNANHGTAAWDELSRLGEEIGRGWTSHQTSAELLSDMRR
jgi:prevent-host-death family protein